MEQGFLEQEAKAASKKNKTLFSVLTLVYVVLMAAVCFAVKDMLDFDDVRTVKVVVCLGVLSGVMLISVVIGLIASIRSVADASRSLLLPFAERTKEEAARLINREAAEGKILFDEYIYKFTQGQKPYGARVVLLPSYLLLGNGMGKITAIPREHIYWLCAQVGRKGSSSFIVRLLIFTGKKTFSVEGIDVEHVEKLAERLYQYIPNVFCAYDPFVLSYELEKLFDKNRAEFLKFYEEEKNKTAQE